LLWDKPVRGNAFYDDAKPCQHIHHSLAVYTQGQRMALGEAQRHLSSQRNTKIGQKYYSFTMYTYYETKLRNISKGENTMKRKVFSLLVLLSVFALACNLSTGSGNDEKIVSTQQSQNDETTSETQSDLPTQAQTVTILKVCFSPF
jgi:hypothetical protein